MDSAVILQDFSSLFPLLAQLFSSLILAQLSPSSLSCPRSTLLLQTFNLTLSRVSSSLQFSPSIVSSPSVTTTSSTSSTSSTLAAMTRSHPPISLPSSPPSTTPLSSSELSRMMDKIVIFFVELPRLPLTVANSTANLRTEQTHLLKNHLRPPLLSLPSFSQTNSII